MKHITNIVFLILLTAGWNSRGIEFSCRDGREGYEELEWDLQNEEGFSQRYKASIRYRLFKCQMHYGEDLEDAFQNLKESAELGKIISNFTLAQYLLTGGWGKNPSVQSREEAIWEFEKTLEKINGAGADYPNDPSLAEHEIWVRIYPNTLVYLIEEYTNKWLNDKEGLPYYENKNPAHYNDPSAILARSSRVNINMLNPLEYHIDSCLADHRGQDIPDWARRFSDYLQGLESKITEYNALYLKVKTKYCPLFKELLDEIRKREANMQKIARHCAPPSEQATAERPPCANIQKEIEEFDVVFKDIVSRHEKKR